MTMTMNETTERRQRYSALGDFSSFAFSSFSGSAAFSTFGSSTFFFG
jgi:hypothetical protein